MFPELVKARSDGLYNCPLSEPREPIGFTKVTGFAARLSNFAT